MKSAQVIANNAGPIAIDSLILEGLLNLHIGPAEV